MYKIVTMEDTIRIPAEYMRKGASLNDHIDRLAMTAFEGRFNDDQDFVLVTSNHQPLGRGRIIHGDGAIYQKVKFDAVLFCMDDHEVVEGAISEVNEFGAFVRIGANGSASPQIPNHGRFSSSECRCRSYRRCEDW